MSRIKELLDILEPMRGELNSAGEALWKELRGLVVPDRIEELLDRLQEGYELVHPVTHTAGGSLLSTDPDWLEMRELVKAAAKRNQ